MKYRSKVVWCLCLLLAGLAVVVVVPHIAHAATRCEACKGTGRDICEFCGGVGCAQCNFKGGKYSCSSFGFCSYAKCRYCDGEGVIYTAAEKDAMEKTAQMRRQAVKIITLRRNKGSGYDNWQALYDIPSSVRGNRITAGDTYTFTYSFKSDVAITGNLIIFLVDESATAKPRRYWSELSEHKVIKTGIPFNTEISGTVTLNATQTVSSTEEGENTLVFQINPASNAASEPTLFFSSFSLKLADAGRLEREAAEREKRKREDAEQVRAAPAAARASIGTFTDSRDGKSYKKLTVGSQTWMAENLNYGITKTIRVMVPDTIYTNNKKKKIKEITRKEVEKTVNTNVCYDNDPANCEKYGSLYDWNTAMTACPVGWHLPSKAEWDALTNYVGAWETAGKKLKSTSGWKGNGNGTDEYGFSALPGGYVQSDGIFGNTGDSGRWWSATKGDDGNAWILYMEYAGGGARMNAFNNRETSLFSVRCVQD